MNPAVKFSLPVILSLVAVFLAGCATKPATDWNTRVGHYTYNEALTDFGMPNRQARLIDGKVQSSWFIQAPVTPRVNSGMSYYGSQGFAAGQTPGAGLNAEMLQLTFDTNGVLSAWSKNQ
jgi:hypothetical protein